MDKTVYSLKVEVGKTATLKVSDTPKVTDTDVYKRQIFSCQFPVRISFIEIPRSYYLLYH